MELIFIKCLYWYWWNALGPFLHPFKHLRLYSNNNNVCCFGFLSSELLKNHFSFEFWKIFIQSFVLFPLCQWLCSWYLIHYSCFLSCLGLLVCSFSDCRTDSFILPPLSGLVAHCPVPRPSKRATSCWWSNRKHCPMLVPGCCPRVSLVTCNHPVGDNGSQTWLFFGVIWRAV